MRSVFYTKIQDGRQKWLEKYFGKSSRLSIYPVGQKFGCNRSILHRFWDKCIFEFYEGIQDDHQNGGKTIFGKSRQYTMQIPGRKFPRNHSTLHCH